MKNQNPGGGPGLQPLAPGTQVNVDLRNAKKLACKCGSELFKIAFEIYRVSAVVSPIGKDLNVQKPVLLCMECDTILQEKGSGNGSGN